MKQICKKMYKKINKIYNWLFIQIHWLYCMGRKNWMGVTKDKYEKEIIVSLTSFPDRIKKVHKAIRSLLMQSQKPNRIILWLAKEQFINGEKDLPHELIVLQRYGLEIKWCYDLGSYKKLIPALKLYPDSIIVTADDDLYYRNNWLSLLYKEHLKYPGMVCAHRITKFYLEDNRYKIVPGGYDRWYRPTYLHKLTGGGGAMFPPNVLYKDITNEDIFMKECTTNDDIWFWLMAVLNGTKICVVPEKSNLNLIYISGTQKGPCLSKLNDIGEKLFWKDFNNMLAYYPEIDGILRAEFQSMKTKRFSKVSKNAT